MADQGAHVGGETIFARTIEADCRLALCPRPVEQRQEPVMEDVEEIGKRGIARMQLAIPRVLSQVKRQRAIRAEQPEEAHIDAEPPVCAVAVGVRERGGRKGHGRFLAQANRFIGRPHALAETRLVRKQGLDVAQCLIEIEREGGLLDRLEKG